MPCSTLPVTTVPRPVMVKTSSMGMRKGLSTSRGGSGDVVVDRVHQLVDGRRPRLVALQRLEGADPDDGGVVARVLVLVEQVPDLEVDQVEQLLVVDRVGLVEGDHDVGHPHLAGQQHVLPGLGHGAVGRATRPGWRRRSGPPR